MQRIGVVIVMFLLAVGISLGISYFLWGQPDRVGESTSDTADLDALRARLARVEAQLRDGSGGRSEGAVSDEDFEALLSRLDAVERGVKSVSNASPGALEKSSPEIREILAREAEEKAREVYKDMKDEERRKQEEEWRQRREERWKETQEWLTNVYSERLALLTKELSLTPNQEAAVGEAIDARRESVLKIYARRQVPEDERPAGEVPSWDDINKAYETSMKQILNQEQHKKYKQKHLDDFNRGRGRGRGR